MSTNDFQKQNDFPYSLTKSDKHKTDFKYQNFPLYMYKIKDITKLIKFMSKNYGIIWLYIVILDYSIQLNVTIIQSEPFKTKVYKSPCP